MPEISQLELPLTLTEDDQFILLRVEDEDVRSVAIHNIDFPDVCVLADCLADAQHYLFLETLEKAIADIVEE